MLKDYIERFKFNVRVYFDDFANPRNSYCKLSKFYKVLSNIYQTFTFWERHCREFLYQMNRNYGKLLDYTLYTNYQRTRDKKTIKYYYTTTYFCRIKVYEIKYIKNNKTVNIFMHFINSLLSNDVDEPIKKKTCIYSAWGFTKNQCITAFTKIRALTKDLNWEAGMCNEYRAYEWAKLALDYLNGKSVYFSDEKDLGLKQEIYLITRDIENRRKYVYELQNLMYLVLQPDNDERNLQLKKLLKDLLKKFNEEGYKSFSCLYR